MRTCRLASVRRACNWAAVQQTQPAPMSSAAAIARTIPAVMTYPSDEKPVTPSLSSSRKLLEIRDRELHERRDRPEARRHGRERGEPDSLRAVPRNGNVPDRGLVDIVDRAEDHP